MHPCVTEFTALLLSSTVWCAGGHRLLTTIPLSILKWVLLHCRAIDNEGAYENIEVHGERVDSVVKEDVLLIKLDVEGFEPTAFRSSKALFDKYR